MYTVIKIIIMKNATFIKYRLLKGKKKDLEPKITKLRSCRTGSIEPHVTYIFFCRVGMDID